jgi:hypothetical protein
MDLVEFAFDHRHHRGISSSDGSGDPVHLVVGAAGTQVLKNFSTGVVVGFAKALYSVWDRAWEDLETLAVRKRRFGISWSASLVSVGWGSRSSIFRVRLVIH